MSRLEDERQPYPPLPEMSDLGDSGASNYGYSEEDMRAYIDADRASRAALNGADAGVSEGWQDIATAPKDGSAVLARSSVYELPFVVFWSSKAEYTGPMPALPPGTEIQRRWLVAGAEDPDILYSPDEWQPLPSAPTQGGSHGK